MSIAVVDARGWQNTIDLRTGEKAETDGPVVGMVRRVLQRHPYPGDLDPGSNRWVTDTALGLVDGYSPRFVFLTYATQYFLARYTPTSREERTRLISDAFAEVERFERATGFDAVIVGTGAMTDLEGFIDVTVLDGLALCTHWSARYAGLYGPSREDMRWAESHPHIERIVPREEVKGLFGGTAGQGSKLPEYLMVAADRYAFKSVGDARRSPIMIPAASFDIPVHAPGHAPGSITHIRRVLEKSLAERKTALIVMEGVGSKDFMRPYVPCRNGMEWCCYEPGEAQYLTIATGKHCFLDYPPGSGTKYLGDVTEAAQEYPFSGHFKSIPEGTLGSAFEGRSIAVGNRSMFMHMVAGADVSIECFARNLYNQGTMGVIHREDKAG